jgi:hypothetical protein
VFALVSVTPSTHASWVYFRKQLNHPEKAKTPVNQRLTGVKMAPAAGFEPATNWLTDNIFLTNI